MDMCIIDEAKLKKENPFFKVMSPLLFCLRTPNISIKTWDHLVFFAYSALCTCSAVKTAPFRRTLNSRAKVWDRVWRCVFLFWPTHMFILPHGSSNVSSGCTRFPLILLRLNRVFGWLCHTKWSRGKSLVSSPVFIKWHVVFSLLQHPVICWQRCSWLSFKRNHHRAFNYFNYGVTVWSEKLRTVFL